MYRDGYMIALVTEEVLRYAVLIALAIPGVNRLMPGDDHVIQEQFSVAFSAVSEQFQGDLRVQFG